MRSKSKAWCRKTWLCCIPSAFVTVNLEIVMKILFSGSFVKIKPTHNGQITLSFTDVFLLTQFAKIKFPRKFLNLQYSIYGVYCNSTCYMQYFDILASPCSWADWFDSYEVGNLKDMFSRVEAQIKMNFEAYYDWEVDALCKSQWYECEMGMTLSVNLNTIAP